jgi:alkylation response protein AidB-like acyl-CoA dehydrogenase
MDTRDSVEQAELRSAARKLARELGPATVAALDDDTRRMRLASAVRDAGWLELRDDAGDGAPLASGVEAAIVADALGGAVADVAFTGPVLAADLCRRAGIERTDPVAVAFAADLTPGAPAFAVDAAADATHAYAVDDHEVVRVALVADGRGSDLTRSLRGVAGDAAVVGSLSDDDRARWTALGLALTSADLVGVMRGVLAVTVAYAAERRQYDVPIGSFQAVQHLLAEAHTLMEGAHSVALHASWAVDDLDGAAALDAGRVAKAYCARAARTACETAVQVHGGIGNTWECIVHVYLRRALLSARWFGDDGAQLRALASSRLGGRDGLP